MPMKKSGITIIFISAFIMASGIWASDERPAFELFDPGTEKAVLYERYGEFTSIGTFEYKYTIKDESGLTKASGEGIDPNRNVEKDPAYPNLLAEGRLKGSPWKHVETNDPQADFFVWSTAYKEDGGLRLFFEAKALEKAGLYLHAIKAYRAAMILYPDSFCWNRSNTWTWLIAPGAWNEIINLTRIHPELNLKLVGAYVSAQHAIGQNPAKNRIAVIPGHFINYTEEGRGKDSFDVTKLKVLERGLGKVACVKYSNGKWGMEVDGKPFFVRGVHYAPTKVGKDYNWNWMEADENKNGLIDVAYETWVDTNRNNYQDKDEKVVGDFQLLKEMGCNTIRILNTNTLNKKLLGQLYRRYGIRVLICDPLGAYTVHSGADWNRGTDYSDPAQRERMSNAVRDTVLEYKDEDWLLGYILGNENNMPCDYTGVNATRTLAASQPEIYAKFLNEVAAMVHKLDPNHPVGVGNFGLGLVDSYAAYAPSLDFIGINEYPGVNGFGSLWIQARKLIDRPILITETGCDAYATGKGLDEDAQALYHLNCWQDIEYNSASGPGEGSAIGGIVFEWCDEWWKDTRQDPLDKQATEAVTEMAFPDGWCQEEWLGIVGQGNGRHSPFQRDLRKAYFVYKQLWNK